MSCERVKWDAPARQWRVDPTGIHQDEAARRYGFVAPPRAPVAPIPAAFTRPAARELARAFEARLKAAVTAAKAKAARRAATRVRARLYFYDWWLRVGKARRAERRAAARAAP